MRKESLLIIAVMKACSKGNMELTKYLISRGADELNEAMNNAIYSGNREVIDYLISNGANDWQNFLYYSCKYNKKELAEFFISQGANNFDYCKKKNLSNLLFDNFL